MIVTAAQTLRAYADKMAQTVTLLQNANRRAIARGDQIVADAAAQDIEALAARVTKLEQAAR